MQREIAERADILPRRIFEDDMVERDAALGRFGERDRVFGRGNAGLFLEQFAEARRRTGTAQKVAINFGQ